MFSLNRFRFSEITIDHKKGISVLPNVTEPKPNDISKGFRILRDKLEGDVYSVDVQGLNGSKNEMKIYLREGNIISVENGKIISSNNSIYIIAVDFEKSSSKYLNKTIKIEIARRSN